MRSSSHPVSAIWVVALFVFIYQVEGHIVVPNVMANALRLHPLLVIFGLLAGGELYGMPGVLLALPTMAALARDLGVLLASGCELDQWGRRTPPPPLSGSTSRCEGRPRGAPG